MEWKPIETAPSRELIYITAAGYMWQGTGKYFPGEDWEDEKRSHCSVVHYNGNVLVPVFYATHWKPITKASLAAGAVKGA